MQLNFSLLGQLPEFARASLCEITKTNFITRSEGAGTGVVIREDDGAYLYSNALVFWAVL